MTTNQPTVQKVKIETNLDELQVIVAVARHQAINNKKAVDTNIMNILIGLLTAHPELIDDAETHVITPTCSHTHCSDAQEKVLDLIFDEDWQGLFNLSDFGFMDLA